MCVPISSQRNIYTYILLLFLEESYSIPFFCYSFSRKDMPIFFFCYSFPRRKPYSYTGSIGRERVCGHVGVTD